MDRELARQVHQIFAGATRLPPGERARFITDACGDHLALRSQVNAMLAAVDRADTFLETPALAAMQTTGLPAEPEPPTEQVGSYCVLRILGSGGMATVYEAQQERPRRRVAVKIMRRGLLHTAAIARFMYETEVLARMQHPNIAQIFEVGTWEQEPGLQVPFFAMEFIPGARPITHYAREERLPRDARLELFLSVCDAVQYGHQLGVIHRDLKPGNILIDERGHPKVIDFGVARSTDPDQAWITASVDHDQLIGTLNYMSPEQCVRGAAIDTRCDVYSLGVVLYELLCDRLPHDLSAVPLPEALRIIREDPPPRPAAINLALRGDIDLIVRTAIAKDPERRYRTVAAMTTDIRRALASLPIEARPPTLRYQLTLFTRRNRRLVTTAAVTSLVVMIAAAVSMTFAFSEHREAQRRRAAETTALAERDAALRSVYVATMAAGFAAYHAGEHQEVRSQLAAAPEALRGWEWRFLRAVSERSLRVINTQGDMVYDLAISPDGRRLATAARDGHVRVWDPASGEMLIDLAPDRGGGMAAVVSFDPTGQRLAAGFADGVVRIWNVESGSLIESFTGHERRVQHLVWLADGSIASSSADGRCLVWLPGSGTTLHDLTGLHGATRGVAASPDGSLLVTWNREGLIQLLDPQSLELLLHFDFEQSVQCVAISDDNTTLAAGGAAGRVMTWSIGQSATSVDRSIAGTPSLVRHLAISPDGRSLAASNGDRTIQLIPLTDDAPPERLQGHEETVAAARFSPDGSMLYSASWDRSLRVWGLVPAHRADFIRLLTGHDGELLSTAFAPDGGLIASAGRDDTVRLFDPELGTAIGTLHGHEGDVSAVTFSPDGAWIATGSYDRTIRLWNARTGAAEPPLEDHTAAVWTIAFSPDGKQIASAGDDAIIRIWDVATRTVLHRLKGHSSRVVHLAFSPDGRQLATASRDQTVRVWHVESGTARHTLSGHDADVFAVLFHPDGQRLYSGSRDQTVRVWDTDSGKQRDVLDGHGQFITSLSISPDGTRLAGGSWFGQVVLWDVDSHRHIATLRGQLGVIRSVAFSPNGRWLAASSSDGNVRLLDSAHATDRLEAVAAAHAARSAAEMILQGTESPPHLAAAPPDDLAPANRPAIQTWIQLLTLSRHLASQASDQTAP